MRFMSWLRGLFRPSPPPREVAEYHALADQVVETSQKIVHRLEDDPIDRFIIDVKERRPRKRNRAK